ncbi:MAG: DUF4266 domain-containing protein [Gammaproteobacteria bacterium]|nr:DUF4266 domain-containing protein [Gammaproteobacteria bacterium]
MVPKALKIVTGLIVLLLASCQTVEPWERDRLAKQDMQLTPNVLDARLADQVFFSKEAASGGGASAGGGCGCN